jgi:hypothetical protein
MVKMMSTTSSTDKEDPKVRLEHRRCDLKMMSTTLSTDKEDPKGLLIEGAT